jgi:NADH dehydrogenase
MQIQHVIIIGGGFGGLYAAKALNRASVNMTLIDRRNFHLFQPLLYQVATGGLSPGDIASPLRSILKKQKNVQVILGEVIDVNPGKKHIILRDGELSYDTLIVATGAHHHYFGNNLWETSAFGLKTIEDATAIRSKILRAFENGEKEADHQKRNALLSFVIVGGGPSGVELAGAIGELARDTLKGNFRNIDPTHSRIVLIESYDRILPQYPPKLSAKALETLNRLGVEVMTNAVVTQITEEYVAVRTSVGDIIIPSYTVLWAAGVKASLLGELLAKRTKAETDKAGRIIVTEKCYIPDFPEIFVIGDVACFKDSKNKPLPGVATVAIQQGRYVSNVIKRQINGFNTPVFKYRDKGSLAVIGRASAVAFRRKFYLSGYFAWLLWLFVHLLYLMGFENRILVMIQWAFNYFTKNRGARLITGEKHFVKDLDFEKNDKELENRY